MTPFYKFMILFVLFIICDIPFLYYNVDKYKNITTAISKKPYTTRYYSVAMVYVALALGLMVFVLPLIKTKMHTTINTTKQLQTCIIYGGLFGVVTYGVFDFTTHFMFKDWDLQTSIIDTVWGGVLCSIVAFIALKYL